jgi:hypothetical protein
MPHPRAVSIVLCSCGWRAGNLARAAKHEDMEAAELALVEAETPRMVRHFQLGHHLRLNEKAPRAYAWVVTNAAREMAGSADDGEAEPVPAARRLGAIED